ncbi:polysaccharide biosynthesis C-terminal domain-containing protein [Avibacterium paragallinarum]
MSFILRKYIKNKSVFQGTFIILICSLGAALIAFLTNMILVRNLSVGDYGFISSQITLLNLLSPCIALGLSTYWLKLFAKEGNEAYRWIKPSKQIIQINIILLLIFLIFYAYFNKETDFFDFMLLSTYCYALFSVEISVARSQIDRNYKAQALFQISPHIIRFVSFLFILFVFEQLSLKNTIYIYAFSSLIVIFISYKKNKIFLCMGDENKVIERKKDLVKGSVVFWLAGIFYLTYVQSSVYLVNLLSGSVQAGLFSAVFVLIMSTYIFPSVIYQKILTPFLHRWAYHDERKLKLNFQIGSLIMLVLGLFTFLFIYIYSETIVYRLYGDSYLAAIGILKVISLAIPLRFVSSSMGSILSTKDFMKIKVYILAIAAILNVVCNFYAIKYYDAIGAAVVMVFTELFVLLVMWFFCYKYFKTQSNSL